MDSAGIKQKNAGSKGQRLLLSIGGATIVVLSLVSLIPDSTNAIQSGELNQKVSEMGLTDASSKRARWGNPSVSWWNKTFCRGGRTAWFCTQSSSYNRYLHPFESWFEEKNYNTPKARKHRDKIINERIELSTVDHLKSTIQEEK